MFGTAPVAFLAENVCEMTTFDKIPEKIKNLFMFILSLVSSKFTGWVKIHFNQGHIGDWDEFKKHRNKHEEVK